MGKKKNAESSLGRSLIKDRFGGKKHRKFVGDNSMVSSDFAFGPWKLILLIKTIDSLHFKIIFYAYSFIIILNIIILL